MYCKFQNKDCRDKLQKRRVEDWNKSHPIEFQIKELDPLDNSSYIRFSSLLDESLHSCREINIKKEM